MSYEFLGLGFVLYYKWVFVFLLLTIVLLNRRQGANNRLTRQPGKRASVAHTAKRTSHTRPLGTVPLSRRIPMVIVMMVSR